MSISFSESLTQEEGTDILVLMDLNKHRASAYLKGAGKVLPQSPEGLVKKVEPGQGKAAAEQSPAAPRGLGIAGAKPGRTEIAKYLILIGPEEATKVLKHLGEAEVEALAREISSIEKIDPAEGKIILDRFQGLVRTGTSGTGTGGTEVAKGILKAAFGEERGNELFLKAIPQEQKPFFSFLQDLDPVQVQAVLRPETAAIKSIVLAYLPPATAAAIIKACGSTEQKDIIVRMATMKRIDKDVLARIETALKERVRDAAKVVNDEIDGRASLANIMRFLDPQLEQGLLDELTIKSPDLAQEIRDRLFTVDTILLIDDRDFQKVLAALEDKWIAMLLKGKSEDIRQKFLKNVSDSRSRLIAEEFDVLGPQLRRDVDQATRDFISTLKAMEAEGTIRVRREEDEYV